MKSSQRMILAVACLTVGLCLFAGTPSPQDAVKVAPDHFKVLLENDRVRVLDVHTKAGEKIGMHSHPAYLTYLVSGSGKTIFTTPEGQKRESTAQAGQATWHEAETHSSESSGTTHVVLIELKK